jgi:hypothetical protein
MVEGRQLLLASGRSVVDGVVPLLDLTGERVQSTVWLHTRVARTWAILGLATLVGPLVFFEGNACAAAAVGVLGIAAVKGRLIALDFMGLRDAPWGLRAVIEFYWVALRAVPSNLYLWLGG